MNKSTTALAIIFVVLGRQSLSAAPPPDGAILLVEPYRYPDAQKLTETQARNLANYYTDAEYAAAMAPVRADGYELLDVWYRSGGLRVRAYVYRPKAMATAKLPAILYNRGSGPMDDQGFVFAPFFHRLAQAGFVVVAPQYREGAGGEGRDEIGGADLEDVMSAVALCANLGYVDVENLFMYGESRGGMMTFQAIRDRAPVRAAATFGGFTDLEATLAAMPWQQPAKTWADWDEHKADIIERRSALHWVERLSVPLLLMHGGADPQISPAQTLRLALRLQELGRPYELVVYQGDGHILKQNQIDRDARAIAWFKKHLKP
jgi:dipeptidyl aminopeptidase/acylaminoacyl peptidase